MRRVRVVRPHARSPRLGDEFLTKSEVAQELKVSERTVQRLVASGRLPALREGKLLRIRTSDLESFVRGSVAQIGQKAAESGIEMIFGVRPRDPAFQAALNDQLLASAGPEQTVRVLSVAMSALFGKNPANWYVETFETLLRANTQFEFLLYSPEAARTPPIGLTQGSRAEADDPDGDRGFLRRIEDAISTLLEPGDWIYDRELLRLFHQNVSAWTYGIEPSNRLTITKDVTFVEETSRGTHMVTSARGYVPAFVVRNDSRFGLALRNQFEETLKVATEICRGSRSEREPGRVQAVKSRKPHART